MSNYLFIFQRLADALNINLKAASNASRQIKSGQVLQTPKRTAPTKKPVADIDDFDQIAIRNIKY